MKMVSVAFSINLYDKDGDKFDDCLLLYIDDNLLLRLSDLKDLDNLIKQLQSIRNEVAENNNP